MTMTMTMTNLTTTSCVLFYACASWLSFRDGSDDLRDERDDHGERHVHSDGDALRDEGDAHHDGGFLGEHGDRLGVDNDPQYERNALRKEA